MIDNISDRMRGAMAQQSDRREMMNGESVCPAAPDSGGEKSAIQKRRRTKVSGTPFLIPKHGSEHVIPTQMPVFPAPVPQFG